MQDRIQDHLDHLNSFVFWNGRPVPDEDIPRIMPNKKHFYLEYEGIGKIPVCRKKQFYSFRLKFPESGEWVSKDAQVTLDHAGRYMVTIGDKVIQVITKNIYIHNKRKISKLKRDKPDNDEEIARFNKKYVVKAIEVGQQDKPIHTDSLFTTPNLTFFSSPTPALSSPPTQPANELELDEDWIVSSLLSWLPPPSPPPSPPSIKREVEAKDESITPEIKGLK